MMYDEGIGYGFISRGLSSFSEDSSYSKIDRRLYDGVQAKQAIEFRVDLPAGRYWIELLMNAGQKGMWRGEITVNDSSIADLLTPFHTNAEGEAPPAYWTLMRPVVIERDVMILRVESTGQNSTLCGLSLLSDQLGPLRLVDGKVIVVGNTEAPNLELALRQINAGRITEAEKTIYALPEEKYRLIKAHLLLALAGRLEIADPRPLIEWAGRLFQEDLQINPTAEGYLNLKLIRLYTAADMYFKMAGWDWAKKYTRRGIFDRLDLTGFALQEIMQVHEHMLYNQAVWYLGKACFWGWVEQHAGWQLSKADSCFNIVYQYYPDHELLRLYMGKQREDSSGGLSEERLSPSWAVHTSQALKDLIGIINYWVNHRQAENGEFGGKYDDDVEMLRWWPIARMAADDITALLGLRRLVDGIWHSGWIENGFSKKILDVEHAAEPVADTQPMMIGLDYGNPVYVERCMESMQGLYGLWTGVNEKGHRHFRSGWYSATEVDTTPPKDCDVPMNTRTVKAARWLAWYNRHPVVTRFLREWGDAWLEDCLRTDNGKPHGVVPPAVRFHDDRIGGHSDNWYLPGLYWRYYDFHGGYDMMQHFLSLYQLFGDERYLQPIELALKLCKKYLGQNLNDAAPGSEAWVAGIYIKSHGFADVVEQWRLLTGKTAYDPLIAEIGSDYLQFRLTGNVKYLVEGSITLQNGIKMNPELITTEAYYTDRVELKAMRQGPDCGARHLEALYTGKALLNAFYPFSDVCWYHMGPDYAAVVLDSRADYVRIMAYNLSDQITAGAVSFLNLKPGRYLLTQGPDLDEDMKIDQVDLRNEIEIEGPASRSNINLPPHRTQIIEFRKIGSPKQSLSGPIADLALTKSDIAWFSGDLETEIKLRITIHNIGTIKAQNIKVRLLWGSEDELQTIGEQTVSEIPAPLDLKPKTYNLEFSFKEPFLKHKALKIIVDPDAEIREITKINNSIWTEWNIQ